MAEAAFSVDGKYYSAITQDGRLRIWDTETNVLKQEYTPDLHLTSPPSCLQWISATQSAVRTNTWFLYITAYTYFSRGGHCDYNLCFNQYLL